MKDIKCKCTHSSSEHLTHHFFVKECSKCNCTRFISTNRNFFHRNFTIPIIFSFGFPILFAVVYFELKNTNEEKIISIMEKMTFDTLTDLILIHLGAMIAIVYGFHIIDSLKFYILYKYRKDWNDIDQS